MILSITSRCDIFLVLVLGAVFLDPEKRSGFISV
jgi:hypothetical protein